MFFLPIDLEQKSSRHHIGLLFLLLLLGYDPWKSQFPFREVQIHFLLDRLEDILRHNLVAVHLLRKSYKIRDAPVVALNRAEK